MSHENPKKLQARGINEPESAHVKHAPQQRDLVWGYLAQALNIGAGLLLLPIVLRYLPQEDVGLWFVFLTLGGLAQLLEFGFQPTISRNTSYIFAGATSLVSRGVPESFDASQKADPYLLAQLVAASRLIYRAVALGASVVLLLGGSVYIFTLLTPGQQLINSLAAWICYACGSIANFYFGYVNALLQGRGSVSAANKVIIAARVTMLILGIATLTAGMGLLGLGIAMLVSSILGRFLALRLLASDLTTRTALKLASYISGRPVAKTLWHNASRLGIVSICAFLIQRANILIASSFLGLAVAASFSLTVTILMVLFSVSMVIVQVRLPHLARAQSHADSTVLQAMYGELIFIGWATYLAGFIALLFIGPTILVLIGTKTTLLPTWQLLIYGAILALEMNHSIAATYLSTQNSIPFVRSSVLSGLTTLALSLALVDEYQVFGLLTAQGIVQLGYNNWKWPYLVRKQLDFTWLTLIEAEFSRIAYQFKKKPPS